MIFSMRITRLVSVLAMAAFSIAYSAAALAVTEIQWWHAQTGGNNDRINALAKRFNESQSEYSNGKMDSATMVTTAGATISQPSRRWRAASVPPRAGRLTATLPEVDALTGPPESGSKFQVPSSKWLRCSTWNLEPGTWNS